MPAASSPWRARSSDVSSSDPMDPSSDRVPRRCWEIDSRLRTLHSSRAARGILGRRNWAVEHPLHVFDRPRYHLHRRQCRLDGHPIRGLGLLMGMIIGYRVGLLVGLIMDMVMV